MWLKTILTVFCLTSLHELPVFLTWTDFGTFLSYTDFSLVFLLFFFIISSMFDFLFFFYVVVFYPFSYIIFCIFSFLPTHFSHIFAFLKWFIHFWLVSYIVQYHLMFLKFNVHGMLYYKVPLGTKGKPSFRTCDAFWRQWLFVHLPYTFRKIRKRRPKNTAGSQLGK